MATSSGKRKAGAKKARSSRRPKYKVFISHSSLDKFIAERMGELISKAGANYWLDVRDLPGGGNIRDEIKKGVHESQEVIILFSANSVGSDWISFEIGVASAKRKILIPILNNVDHTSIQLLQGMKAVDLNNFSQYLTELKGRVKKWRKH
jgi:hypothetical protein